MPFEKGHKHGKGRPKGSENKNTKDIREAYKKLVEGNLENMTEWIKRVAEKNPAKAFELMNGLSEYILPKLQRTEIKAEVKTEDVDLSSLDAETLKRLLGEDE